MTLLSSAAVPVAPDHSPAIPQKLYVRGVPYANSAARFWLSLLEEVRVGYPAADVIRLATISDIVLEPTLLFPEQALERDLERLARCGTAPSFGDVINACLMAGLPDSVRVELYAGAEALYCAELPRDCVDAEIFAYLTGWLLNWAEIPEAQWNAEHIEGEFSALTEVAENKIAFHFCCRNTHLSEGMYARQVELRLLPNSNKED